MMTKLLAIDFGPAGGSFKGLGPGPLADPAGTTGIAIFSKFLSSVIGLMTIIAIIWFVFSFITGAIGIVASGGDKNALESARKKITTGIVGLVVVIAALFLVKLLGFLLGIPDILNITKLFSQITQ